MRPIRLPFFGRLLRNTNKINELRNRHIMLPHRQKAEQQCSAFLSYPEITFFQFTWSTIFIKCFCSNVFQLFFFVLLLAGSHFVVAGQMVKLSYDTIDKCLLLKKNSFICNHFNQFYTGIYILSVFEKICNKMMYIRLLSTKKRPQSKSLEFIFPFLTSI